eukprot:4757258-Alexandrium_andersonii.AAC.1
MQRHGAGAPRGSSPGDGTVCHPPLGSRPLPPPRPVGSPAGRGDESGGGRAGSREATPLRPASLAS